MPTGRNIENPLEVAQDMHPTVTEVHSFLQTASDLLTARTDSEKHSLSDFPGYSYGATAVLRNTSQHVPLVTSLAHFQHVFLERFCSWPSFRRTCSSRWLLNNWPLSTSQHAAVNRSPQSPARLNTSLNILVVRKQGKKRENSCLSGFSFFKLWRVLC